ncbi:MAG: hypothetical protein WD960_04250 [Gemmatimonadota bacterium]
MSQFSRDFLRAMLVGAAAFAAGNPALEAQQPTSLNPDISVIGDVLADLSPGEPRFSEDGARFSLREVELALQAAVDPFFRADFFLGVHGDEIGVEEAYLTALALPGELQARLGRFHLPLGKANLTHRPELLTVEYPLAIRTYFGPEGFSGSGVGVSRILAPFGFFQEVQLFVLNGIESEGHAHDLDLDLDHSEHQAPMGSRSEELVVGGPERSGREQFGFLAQLRQFHDLTPAANIELGVSVATGSVERYLPPATGEATAGPGGPDVMRHFPTQRLYAAHAVFRWRPPGRGLYRSFRWEVETFGHDGPESRVWGGFSQAQWQTGRRTYLGGRLDAVQLPGHQDVELHGEGAGRHVDFYEGKGGEWRYAASGTLTFFPSEFSRFRLAVERTFGDGWEEEADWRAVLQTTFNIGPHRPHPF